MTKIKNRKRKLSTPIDSKIESVDGNEKPNVLQILSNSSAVKIINNFPHRRDIDVFASTGHTFKAQFEACRKIIKKQMHHPNSKGGTLWIHGLGKSHNRAINLALKLISSADYPDRVKQSIFTDTESIESIEMFGADAEETYSEKVVIHIKLEFALNDDGKRMIFTENKDL